MSRIRIATLLLLTAAASAAAQSGRNVPRPVDAEEESVRGEYSESIPSHRSVPKPTPPVEPATAKTVVPASRLTSERALIANENDIIKVETDLITIPVSVFDRNGLYVPNLQRSDFKVFEDGIEQEIAYFGTTEKPFTVVLLLDTSLSTNYKIEEIRSAARSFVDLLMPQDSVIVIEFDGNVHVLTEVTTLRPRIYKAISKADFGYGTSLYDAVDFTLRKRLNKIQGRKAIVLFTDGVDTTSKKAGYDTTVRMAEEADAMIFPIYYNTIDWNRSTNAPVFSIFSQVGTRPEDYELGMRYLTDLAENTGGRIFKAEATPGGLNSAFEGIAEELRRQYNLGYVPAERGTPGQRKQIRVRVDRPNLVIRSRDSYIVGSTRR